MLFTKRATYAIGYLYLVLRYCLQFCMCYSGIFLTACAIVVQFSPIILYLTHTSLLTDGPKCCVPRSTVRPLFLGLTFPTSSIVT